MALSLFLCTCVHFPLTCSGVSCPLAGKFQNLSTEVANIEIIVSRKQGIKGPSSNPSKNQKNLRSRELFW